MSHDRMDQVNELILRTINEYLTKEAEMPLDAFISLSRVDTSRDLKNATVFITVLPDNKRGTGLRFIKTHSSRIKKYLKKHLYMKNIPNVYFRIDGVEVYGNEIDEIINSVNQEQE